MQSTYTYPRFAYQPSDEQRSGQPQRHPVVIIGAGPIGLTAALECAARGLPAVVLDVRWRSGIVWAWRSAWWTRAWAGSWARYFLKIAKSTSSTCCPRLATGCQP